jgi:hypothetical protein
LFQLVIGPGQFGVDAFEDALSVQQWGDVDFNGDEIGDFAVFIANRGNVGLLMVKTAVLTPVDQAIAVDLTTEEG